MFSEKRYKNKYALLMCNFLESCKEDVIRLEKILNMHKFIISIKIICKPKYELINFLKENKLTDEDLLYIHYSGHGIKRGKSIENKMRILSSWVNPDNSVVCSDEIDNILSNVSCSKILTTDCCHSETFGDFYKNLFPLLFIGTSKINMVSKTYSLNNNPLHGSLVYLFEHILESNLEISLDNIKKLSFNFFKNNNMTTNLIIKNILV